MSAPRQEARVCPCCLSVIRERQSLTSTQKVIYDFIVAHKRKHSCSPSYRIIALEFGYRSQATIHEHVQNLQRKGWITTRFNERQSIEIV